MGFVKMKCVKKSLIFILILATALCTFTACGEKDNAAEVKKVAEGYLDAACIFDYEAALKYVAKDSEQYTALKETSAQKQDAEFIDAVKKVVTYKLGDITVAEDGTDATATFTLLSPDFSSQPEGEYSTWDEYVADMGTVEVERTLKFELRDDEWKITDII